HVAIVTGGGSGSGRALSQALALAGTKVCVSFGRGDGFRATAKAINAQIGSEQVFPYEFDLRKVDDAARLVADVCERWQCVDVLVNNSGLAVPESVDEISEDAWDKVLDTNLRGAMQLVRAVLPHMRRNDFGDIINISSQAGKHGYADVPSYCASKFGLLGYAEALRDDLRKTGANIRVFNFCPGLVDVENTRPDQTPRAGAIHVANMARTLMYALSLDRDVVLEDI